MQKSEGPQDDNKVRTFYMSLPPCGGCQKIFAVEKAIVTEFQS